MPGIIAGGELGDLSDLPEFLRPKLRLFLSVDIVGSTQFKQRGALSGDRANWLPTFIQFYRDIERDFFAQWDAYRSSAGQTHNWPAHDSPEFWKGNGDEVIYTKVLRDHREAFACTFAWAEAVKKYRGEIHGKHKVLDLKATAWLAGFPINNSEVIFRAAPTPGPSSEIAEATVVNHSLLQEFYSTDRSQTLVRDFIGPSIDLGFRLAQLSSPQKMVISLDLALMISHVTPPYGQFKQLTFGYDGRQPLRGAMGGYPYPIFWIDMLEDDRLAMAENDVSRQQRPDKGKVCVFCEEYIKANPELMIRPYIYPGGTTGEFDTIPDSHREQLRIIYNNWISGRANENIADDAARGQEPPDEPLATGEVSEEALGKLVSGISDSALPEP